MLKISSDFVTNIAYIKSTNEMAKLVIKTKEICNKSRVVFNGFEFIEKHNYIEPYERKVHVFYIPLSLLKEETRFTFVFTNCCKKSEYFSSVGVVGILETEFEPRFEVLFDDAYRQADSKIDIKNSTETVIADGVVSKTYECLNKDNYPVRMFAIFVDSTKATMHVGTPNNDYKAGFCSQTVQGEIDCAIRDGLNVVAGTNADFFDMHDTCMPSGIVIKNGKIVANEDSDRPFFAIKKDGTPIITSQYETIGIAKELMSAVCGREIIMRDNKIADLALIEPFGDTRHPRTCVGIMPGNSFVVLVVDGRIPEYSNGATLTDLYLIMKQFGAVNAINLDGGGSSTMIIKTETEGFKMINHPADLKCPFDNLIRDVYNSMLITTK